MNTKTFWILGIVLSLNLSALGCASQSAPLAPQAPQALNNPNGPRAAAESANFIPASSTQDQKYPVSGEINQSYQLSPNASIQVTAIEGAVKVETTNDNTAAIHFVRHARTQRDYDCETIVIQHSASSLSVIHQTNRQCRIILAYEELTLVVPRSANLSFDRIEGSFTVGNTEGYLQLSHIEGSVRTGEVQAADISSIEGHVTLQIARLNSQGITVRNIEGAVELRVAESVNANVRVHGVSNDVQIDVTNATTTFSGRRNYSLQLGTGGAEISISGVEGSVHIRGV
jgi:hypothetical protein